MSEGPGPEKIQSSHQSEFEWGTKGQGAAWPLSFCSISLPCFIPITFLGLEKEKRSGEPKHCYLVKLGMVEGYEIAKCGMKSEFHLHSNVFLLVNKRRREEVRNGPFRALGVKWEDRRDVGSIQWKKKYGRREGHQGRIPLLCVILLHLCISHNPSGSWHQYSLLCCETAINGCLFPRTEALYNQRLNSWLDIRHAI